MMRMRKGYADTPVGQVHYREMGEGAPLLLLHQTAWSSLQFAKAMPFLAARGLRVIAIDTPGYGMSDNFDDLPTIPDYAAQLPHVMDHLGLTSAHVCGHHTGASIAAALAARYPECINKLVLHGVPYYTPEQRAERLKRVPFDQTPQEDGSHLLKRWRMIRELSAGCSLEAAHLSVLQFFWAGPKEWFGHNAAFGHDLGPDLTAIRAPTLIISNTGDTLHAVLDRVKTLRPDFAVAEIQGSTYHVVYDEAEIWSQIVGDFVISA